MKVKQINLFEISMIITIISMMALAEYSKINMIIQIINFSICIINDIKKQKILIRNYKYLIMKLIFVTFCILSYFWAANKENIINWCLGILLRIMTSYTIIEFINSEENLEKVIKFLKISGIILCIRLLILVPINIWGNGRIGIYLSKDNVGYGYTGITYVLGMISTILMCKKHKNKTDIICIIVFIIISLLSGSKKQIFITIIAIMILLLFKSKNFIKALKNITIGILISTIFLIIIMKTPILYNAIGVRLLSFSSLFLENDIEIDKSTETRKEFLGEAFTVFLKNPLNGIGIDGFKYVNRYQFTWAENNFLELLADLGIFGMIIYYMPHLKIILELKRRIKKKKNIDISLLVEIICLVFIDLFMVSYASSTLQFFLAFIYAQNTISICKEEKEKMIN